MGAAHWHQVDLTDPAQVSAAVGGVATSGRIDVLLHCAGLEISHFLPDKPQPEYDLVFDVKAEGWLNVLHAFGEERPGPRSCSARSRDASATRGQTDYAAANDLLCKSVSNMRRRASHARHRDRLDGVVRHRHGQPRLDPEDDGGGRHRHAAARGRHPDRAPRADRRGPGGEVLVAGALGVLLEERHPSGGVDADGATEALAARGGPMTGRITEFSVGGGLRVLTELDPAGRPSCTTIASKGFRCCRA